MISGSTEMMPNSFDHSSRGRVPCSTGTATSRGRTDCWAGCLGGHLSIGAKILALECLHRSKTEDPQSLLCSLLKHYGMQLSSKMLWEIRGSPEIIERLRCAQQPPYASFAGTSNMV